MALIEYSTFVKAPRQEPHHQIHISIISGYSFKESYSTSEMRSAYSTALDDGAIIYNDIL